MIRKPSIKPAWFVLNTGENGGKNLKEIPDFWQAYLTDGRMEKLHGELFLAGHAEYGVCLPENPEDGEFEYVIGVEVKDGHSIPGDYHACTIPGALYAVFPTPPADASNFPPTILGTWKYIFSEWFPNSGYEFDDNGLEFEFYDEHCMNEIGNVCDIYIPVVERQPE